MSVPTKNYCQHLLDSLACSDFIVDDVNHSPLQDWADSGLMFLVGDGESPALPKNSIPSCANQVIDAFNKITKHSLDKTIKGANLLTERAAYLNLQAQNKTSANGSCHLLPCGSECLAFNLSREEDWHLLPALFQTTQKISTIKALTFLLSKANPQEIIERAHLLGLPIAIAEQTPKKSSGWFSIIAEGLEKKALNKSPSKQQPTVIDLSSLWAGPLCSHLLQQAGAKVIKVDSKQRPYSIDKNTPKGHRNFFNLLNNGKQHLTLDFESKEDIQYLKQLIQNADIVIEGSRPRALQQLGINAEDLVNSTPGLVWISLTAYGRNEPQSNWVAFGDDAAIAAGLFHTKKQDINFIGDAIADPLTGMHAALAAYAFWKKRTGALLDINLVNVTRHCLQVEQAEGHPQIIKEKNYHFILEGNNKYQIQKPTIRPSSVNDLLHAAY